MRLDGFGIMVDDAGEIRVMPPTRESWGECTCCFADPEATLIEIGSFGEG